MAFLVTLDESITRQAGLLEEEGDMLYHCDARL
jgi:hypothetical protein